MAGLPALQDGESGQVRKEAATAVYCECRGSGSPPNLYFWTFCLIDPVSHSTVQSKKC